MSARNITNTSYRKVYCLVWASVFCMFIFKLRSVNLRHITATSSHFLDFIHHFQVFQLISPNIALRRLELLLPELALVRDCGLYLSLRYERFNFFFWFPGGAVYPIILQFLFDTVGFSWGVRISGLVSSVICGTATLMVSSLFIQRKAGPYFDISTIADIRFALLAVGSAFVALGEFKTKPFR